MARRRRAEKRSILPDPVYGSVVVAQFINLVMKSGKKSIAESIVYDVLKNISEDGSSGTGDGDGGASSGGNGGALATFEEILDKVGPLVEVKSRRVGGATYQVPIEVRPARKIRIAMSWVIEAAGKRSEKGFSSRLTAECKDIKAGRGAALKKREDSHKNAEANRAFAHFKW